MPTENDLSPYLSIRIAPKTRFGLEIASRLRDCSLTSLIEEALTESFKHISFDPLGELDQDDTQRIHYRLSDKLDYWYDEHPFIRMQLMTVSHAHLMSEDDRAIWEYLFTRPDLFSNGKLNRRIIVENWATIKADALAAKKAEVA